MTPRLSIVIPTRDRPDTLLYAIRSVLEQDFTDLELVVSDNSTTPRTAELLAEIRDPRLKVIQAGGCLSMAKNWMLALSRCEGQFVTYLGDDDALLPGGLTEVDRLLRRTGARALRWDFGTYIWPQVPLPGDAGVLVVSMARQLRRVDGRSRIRESGGAPGLKPIPMVLHGAVERTVLEQARGRGDIFCGRYPDVHSGFVVAAVAGEFAEVTVPLSIAGLSARSTGLSLYHDTGRSSTSSGVRQDFVALNAADGAPTDPRAPEVGTGASHVLDSLFVAARTHFPDDTALLPAPRQVAQSLLESLQGVTGELRRSRIAAIRATLSSPEELAWFDRLAETTEVGALPTVTPRWRGLRGDGLVVDAASVGARDALAAAKLAAVLVGLDGGEVTYGPSFSEVLAHLERLGRSHESLDRYHKEVLGSLSWRITGPLRSLGSFASRVRQRLAQ